ncbi:hypothetical protein [Rheinheimera sp.]|uniref:hypothetical protein n=1 Tax=Rheinheimera sp. TaxID=1869214 RepID=UPI003D28EABB
MGLFSGSKSSSTSSTTTNNSTTLGVQGDLSGILGDGNLISSDNSDRRVDNSNNSRSDWWQDASNNSDNRVDNSDNSSRNFDGQLAGANVGGNVTMTADGAFDFGRDVANVLGATMQTALKNATEQTYLATKANEAVTRDALAFGSDSLRSVENASRYALDTNRATSKEAIEGVLYATESANKASAEAAKRLAETTENSTKAAIDASNAAMQRNAALIQTTALGGQDLMIEGMQKSLMYLGGFLALGFVFMAWGRK